MEFSCLKGTFLLITLGLTSAKDLYVEIAPVSVYMNSTDVLVTCEITSQTLTKPLWITFTRNGWFGKQTIVTFTRNNPPIVGAMFTTSNFTSRMSITGSIEQRRINLMFKTMDCQDEAHYECDAGGFTAQGGLVKYADVSVMEVLSYPEPPSISINGVFVAPMSENYVIDGSLVNLECDAHVGKPPHPMFWFRYQPQIQKYLMEYDLTTKPVRRLPENELCRWYTRFGLRFNATLNEPEIKLQCQVLSQTTNVVIKVKPRVIV